MARVGNTKFIAFEGWTYPGEEQYFTEEALLEQAHGDHAAVTIAHCYLHWDGEIADPLAVPYTIGHLTTHSMVGFRVVDHIVKHMKNGHIVQSDVDWGDSFWLDVNERQLLAKVQLVEKESDEKHGHPFPPTP